MIELGPVAECEMILSFLKAEVDASRYRESVYQNLSAVGFTRDELIECGNLSDATQNSARRTILERYRGFGKNSYLFTGFPADATWRRVELEPHEIDRLLYANEGSWRGLSGGTRNPSQCVQNLTLGQIPPDDAKRIRAVQHEVSRGKRFPELIAAEGQNGKLILIEGHTRATAYIACRLRENIKLFVASSPSMHHWAFY